MNAARKPILAVILVAAAVSARAETTALWLFDEQEHLYPSSVLNDAGSHGYFLVLGRGGEIVPGKFGRALRPVEPPPFQPSVGGARSREEFADAGRYEFGLSSPPKQPGRKVPPLTWFNATFSAVLLNGDKHIRRLPFPHPTEGGLNLGRGDFTIEFRLRADEGADTDGVVIEAGSGPRGENDSVTRLSLHQGEGEFRLFNQPSNTTARLETDMAALRRDWAHCAIVYDSARGELRHYLNGRLASTTAAKLEGLPSGDEDYISVGRDALWNRRLEGAIDELRVSDHIVYRDTFEAPGSFSRRYGQPRTPLHLQKGPPLQFDDGRPVNEVVELAGYKHLFIDDALIARQENLTFSAHPARIEEIVLDHGTGWSTVIEDEEGVIRLYGEGSDGVAVWTSTNGVDFTAPDLGAGRGNQVAPAPARRGSVFIDPNAPPEERWKLLAGLHERGGIFIHTSPDGWRFKRNEAAALPFWAGSASTIFYDDQRQVYVAHHRMDYGRTPGGKTERYFLRTEVEDLMDVWPFEPVTAERKARFRKFMRLGDASLDPWWLDNGPLAPGGFSIEYPIAMGPDPKFDPPATDLYNTRALKYPWAPDTYVAFPLWFFHYEGDGPPTRQVLADPRLQLGNGLVETQLAVSRDGRDWKRYARPAYVPVGNFKGYPMLRPYIAFGLVRRGSELWQYCHTRSTYHSPHAPRDDGIPASVVHRLSQRLDGFVSIDAPYEKEGAFTTHKLRFTGDRLVVNIDAGATGHAQIGFEDEHGRPIPGFDVDDCIYVHGNSVERRVQWLDGNTIREDVSSLSGRPVRLVVRMRGASLYALQFVSNSSTP
ncbi:MAG: LamG-like jellyroll fold domain-containing protein [Opitutaceae bacterium]